MKSVIIVASLALYSQFTLADTYKCQVKKWIDSSKNEIIWKSELKLKSPIDAKVVILEKTPIELDDVVKAHPNQADFKSAMSKYDGQLLVGLASGGDGMLKLSQGVVDSSKKNMGPYEALAWGEPGAKKLGVKNFQRNLEIECEK